MANETRPEVTVDDRGIPTEMVESGHYSAYCPTRPCQLCIGNSAVSHYTENRKMTSWEFCQRFDVCSATIDWYAIYESDGE